MADRLSSQPVGDRVSGRWRWQDLTLAGKSLTSLVHFLVHLGPAYFYAGSEVRDHLYVKFVLLWPWFVLVVNPAWLRAVRLPLLPPIWFFIAPMIGAFVVLMLGAFLDQFGEVAFLATEPVREWVAATAIAGLAAVMTGPLLRGCQAAEEERLARQSSPSVSVRDRST